MINVPKSVKKLFLNGENRKNFRVHFPNGERADIINDNIVYESVKFTESICSGRELEFGIYEANLLEFQCVNVENIKGKTIQASLEVDISSLMGTNTYNFDSVDKEITVDVSVLKPGMHVNVVFDEKINSYSYLVRYEDGNMNIASGFELDAPFSGFEINLSSEHGNVVLFTITVPVNVSATIEIPKDLGFEYMESEDLPYPFYRIDYGTFIVDSCPRQDNMEIRLVTAYSDYINVEEDSEFISPFEREKWALHFKNNAEYEFNPVFFALSNLSQKVNLDASYLGAFSIPATSLKEELAEQSFYPAIYNSYNPKRGEDIGISLVVDSMELDLESYVENLTNLFAYKMGNCFITETYLKNKFLEITEPYKNRITGYKKKLDENVKMLLNFLRPYAHMRDYVKKGDYYRARYAYGMNTTGLLDPNIPNYTGGYYGINFPYKLTIQVKQWVSTGRTETIESHEIDIFDKELFDVDAFLQGEAEIPVVKQKVNRAKNSTGEYILNTDEMPSTIELLNGFFQLNGCFLKKERSADIYRFLWLKDKYGVYPSENLYPSNNIFPSGSNSAVKKSSYQKLWYDEEIVGAYERVVANYKNENDEESFLGYYEPEYQEDFTEYLTTTAYKESESNYMEIVFDVRNNNPFTDGMAVYGTANGVLIEDAHTNIGGNIGFDIVVDESKLFFEQEDYWSNITSITLSLDVSSVAIGTEITVSLGVMERTEIPRERKTLDVSDNYILSNYNIYASYLDAVLSNLFESIKDINYIPARIDSVGMPWLEAGDFLLVYAKNQVVNTILLDRTISGINDLKDHIESL